MSTRRYRTTGESPGTLWCSAGAVTTMDALSVSGTGVRVVAEPMTPPLPGARGHPFGPPPEDAAPRATPPVVRVGPRRGGITAAVGTAVPDPATVPVRWRAAEAAA
jgi:hypothetical protein